MTYIQTTFFPETKIEQIEGDVIKTKRQLGNVQRGALGDLMSTQRLKTRTGGNTIVERFSPTTSVRSPEPKRSSNCERYISRQAIQRM